MLYVLIIDVQRVLYYCLLHEKSISISNANNIYINKRNYMCVKSCVFSQSLFIYFSFRNIRQVHNMLMRLYTLVVCGAISLSEEQHSVT